MDKFWRWIAWRLPKGLAYWVYIRVFAYATTVHSTKAPDELTYSDTMKAWEAR